jgi:hypothetical protein
MNILTHSSAFAQEEYNPYYIPKHFVQVAYRYLKISILTLLLWFLKKPGEAMLWRNEMNDVTTRLVPA